MKNRILTYRKYIDSLLQSEEGCDWKYIKQEHNICNIGAADSVRICDSRGDRLCIKHASACPCNCNTYPSCSIHQALLSA